MFQPLTQTACILALTFSVFFPGEEFLIPAHQLDAPIYSYPGYTLQYNEFFEQADWVAYELTSLEVKSSAAKRTDKFKSDPNITTGSANDKDYLKSGYDRGHLAPAADMKFSIAAMDACFYYSNMSPQNPSFNRTIWASLEARVRYWAVDNKALLIVTGPVLNKSYYPTIGPNEIAVPEFFYKVILDYEDPEKKGIAFIIPNSKPVKPIETYACSIDKVEQLTGIDFFPRLTDSEEIILESIYDITRWPQTEYRE